jgi:hypothetical protein
MTLFTTKWINVQGLPLRALGSLTGEELDWLQEHDQARARETTLPIYEFAQSLVDAEGKTPEEAMAFVMNLDRLSEAERGAVALRYQGKIEALMGSGGKAREGTYQVAAYALNCRLRREWAVDYRTELEESEISLDGGAWTPDLVRKLPWNVAQDLEAFFRGEALGVAPEVEAEEPPTLGEELPPSGSGNPSTGRRSTSKSKAQAGMTPPSTPPESDVFLPA